MNQVFTMNTVSPNPSYTIGDPAISFSFANWTSSIPHCGAINYSSTLNSTVALDSAIITTVFNSTTNLYTVSSSNTAKAGVYTIRITGSTYSPGKEAYSAYTTFTLTVINPCVSAAITNSTYVTDQIYYISDPPFTVITPLMGSNMSDALCGAMTYTVDNGTGYAVNPKIFFYIPAYRELIVYDTIASLFGTYTIRALGYQGTYVSNAHPSSFKVTVLSCLANVFNTTTISPSPTYVIGQSSLTVSFTNWTTSYPNCGTVIYTALNYTGNTALDSNFITFTSNSSTNSFSISSQNVTYAGNKTVTIVGTATSLGGIISSAKTTFSINIVDPCPTASFPNSSYVPD
jgi:hypothetical protein